MSVALRNVQRAVPLRRAPLRRTVTAAHGLCHLLGYRHDTKPEWEQMYQKEAQILEELNRLTGSRLRPLTAGLF
ncbi:PREDICTED: putative ribonuclease isoform X2 [Sturnus vulgaris]|uniref:putative ribonuclease isoform X2 n=1 Tax=Sturnus vulgaris TaxID=9172 RepID=UPI00071A6538|nr:PREDICTED: putative ribonuclease isoform X2 [Sturnus vulgaris]